jgi:hypothetical protein
MTYHVPGKFRDWQLSDPVPEGLIESIAEGALVPAIAYYIGCDADGMINNIRNLIRRCKGTNITEDQINTFFEGCSEEQKTQAIPIFKAVIATYNKN